MKTSATDVTIDQTTKIPVGIAAAVIGGALTAGLVLIGWISTMIWEGSHVWLRLEATVAAQGQDIQEIKIELQETTSSRWTSQDQQHWVDLFRAQNQDVFVPDAW